MSGKVAIIGMACLFPGAPDLATFWSNIVGRVDAITEAGESEWDLENHFEPGSTSFARTYAKRGGFISDIAHFDPLRFGVMPNALKGSDPDQLLTLKVAYDALADAGYLDREFNRDRAEIVLGRISAPGAGSMNLIQQSKTVGEITNILRSILSEHDEDVIQSVAEQLKEKLHPCTSDNIPSVMPNVLAGRVAAKLGFRGRNLLIDAACASSMVAIETAVDDLLANRCDFALTGGLHVNSSATFFKLFAGLGALSQTDTIRPFDENADGTLLGEGIGIICLKRYEDAIADGDRIYATICGVASSSDGYGGSVLAPSLEGEALALQRAYDDAGINPRTVELLEAHGTATPTGDAIELQAVAKVFGQPEQADRAWCAVGSIKSMIGHCQSASAVAGVIKAALALYQKVLPPTINVTAPNSKIDWSKHPCYINTETRPWIHAGQPRRAAVSAFGFGGINAHAVMEEHGEPEVALAQKWDSEVFAISSPSRGGLAEKIQELSAYVAAHPDVCLKDLAYTTNGGRVEPAARPVGTPATEQRIPDYRLAIVAANHQELQLRLRRATDLVLNPNNTSASEPERGIHFTAPDARIGGKLAFLYPGLGSAYTNMLADLCLHFPEVRAVFDICDNVALRAGAKVAPSKFIFPQTAKSASGVAELASADFAVVAVLLAEYALHELLRHLDIHPDVLLGCSTGEFAAITTGGAVDVLGVAETFYKMSTNAARSIPAEKLAKLRSLRVLAPAKDVMKFAGKNVYLSADLGEDHIILTGSEEAIADLSTKLREKKMAFQPLLIAIPYHTPLVGDLVDANHEVVRGQEVGSLNLPTWACSLAAQYENHPEKLRENFTTFFSKPVRLRETINAMYEEGVRKFVEVGPNGVLSVVVGSILAKRPHISIASNLQSKSGIAQLHNLLAVLFTQGANPKFDYLYSRRSPQKIDFAETQKDARRAVLLDLRHTALTIDPDLLPRRTTIAETGDDDFQHVFEHDHESVLETFLSTNTAFYERMNTMQEQVMKAFLSTATATDIEPPNPAAIDGLPFLSRMQVSEQQGVSVAKLNIALDQDLYLLDHAIGGLVSTEPNLRLYLMPLMVALEIMAEVAYLRADHQLLVRVEQVKAFRRIVVDQQGLELTLRARVNGERIHVELLQSDDESPSMMADYVFSDDYRDATTQPLRAQGGAPQNLTTHSSLYTPLTMFHGPRMQSVQSIDIVGDRELEGSVTARAASGWFPDLVEPRFLIDPLLLDNGSQFVLFYLYEKNLPATALLPFFIESIDVFGARDVLETDARGCANLTTLSNKATEANVEISDATGFVWCRVNNINSRRIALPPQWQQFVLAPLQTELADTVCGERNIVVVDEALLPEDETVLDWCADYVLTKSERAIWKVEAKTAKRKTDWLLGRIAAKEAVRRILPERVGFHNIEIHNTDNRVPKVRLLGSAWQYEPINVSLSHSSGAGVATACYASEGQPGIDVEQQGRAPADMSVLFATEEEIALLNQGDLTKLWSAKESLFKACRGELEMHTFILQQAAPTTLVLTQGEARFRVHFIEHHQWLIAHARI